jgi:hypothetical protein
MHKLSRMYVKRPSPMKWRSLVRIRLLPTLGWSYSKKIKKKKKS